MFWVLSALLLSQDPFPRIGVEPQRTIIDVAFDPTKFRPATIGFTPMVSIRYLGDDYAYPVYAIAIDRECRGASECEPTMMARMVRAPNFRVSERPRWAGMAVVRHVEKAGATTPAAVAAALDTAGLEWLEADLRNCPHAAAMLADTSAMVWASPVIIPALPSSGIAIPPPPPPLHADRISVAFDDRLRWTSVHSGAIEKGRPTGWAVDLARELEPCWRPSSATPPWRR